MSKTEKMKLKMFKTQAVIMLFLWLIIVFISINTGFFAFLIISVFTALFILFLLGISSWIMGINKILTKEAMMKPRKTNRIGF